MEKILVVDTKGMLAMELAQSCGKGIALSAPTDIVRQRKLKVLPHQSQQEKARRLRQLQCGILQPF